VSEQDNITNSERNRALHSLTVPVWFLYLAILFGGCSVSRHLSRIADALDRAYPKQEQKP
jgi:hypothetical protein